MKICSRESFLAMEPAFMAGPCLRSNTPEFIKSCFEGSEPANCKGSQPHSDSGIEARAALYQVYNFGTETQRLLLRLPPQHCVHKARSKQEQGESQSFSDKSTWSWASLGGGTRGGRSADLLTLCNLQGQRKVSCSWGFSQVLCMKGPLYQSP